MRWNRRLSLPLLATAAVAACSTGSDQAPDAAASASIEMIDRPAANTTEPETRPPRTDPEPEPELETIPPVGAGDSLDEPAAEESTVVLPDPDQQWFLRTLWEHTVGDGPGSIERDVGFAPTLLEAGTYTTDSMYTSLTFTLDRPMRLIAERPTFTVLVDPSAVDLWDEPIVHLIRPRGLVDPTHTSDGPPDWPPITDDWDFAAWFDAHPGLDVERSTVQIDDVSVDRFDVSFPPDSDTGWQCGPETRCIAPVLDYSGPFDLTSDDSTRLWVIPQESGAPILVHAAIGRTEEWGAFGETADALVGSITLGPAAPVDIPDDIWEAGLSAVVPAGEVHFPILDGIRFDLPTETFVRQDRNWSYITVPGDWDFYEPNVEIAAAMQTYDFERIESAEQLAGLLVEVADATRLPDQRLLGRRAAVVEMRGVQPGIPVFRHLALPDEAHPDVGVWRTQDYVELWAVDTDAGVLIVTAEAANPTELDIARELHVRVRESLTLGG